jgi:hypothetical protein
MDRIVKAFSLPADKGTRVSGYWHELESGRRRPADVAPELWDKVVELLGPAAEAARDWSPRPLLAADVKYGRVGDATVLTEPPRAGAGCRERFPDGRGRPAVRLRSLTLLGMAESAVRKYEDSRALRQRYLATFGSAEFPVPVESIA